MAEAVKDDGVSVKAKYVEAPPLVERQVLPIAKQPVVRLIPLAKVELAVAEVALKMVEERPAAKDEVAVVE